MNEWNKIELHCHTKIGMPNSGSEEILNFTYSNFVNMFVNKEVKLVSVTNHNIIDLIHQIKLGVLLKKKNINLIPGVELDVIIKSEKHHVVIIFDSLNDLISLNKKIADHFSNLNVDDRYIELESLIPLLCNKSFVFIPHGRKARGFKNPDKSKEGIYQILEILRDKEIFCPVMFETSSVKGMENYRLKIENIARNHWLYEDKTITCCSFVDRLDWLDESSLNVGKMSINAMPSYDGLTTSLFNPNKRLQDSLSIPIRSNYISKIVIDDSSEKVNGTTIELSSSFNAIIGQSGSGKTMLLNQVFKKVKNVNFITDANYDSILSTKSIKLYDENNSEILNMENLAVVKAEELYSRIQNIYKSDPEQILNIFDISKEEIPDFKNIINTLFRSISEYTDLYKVQKMNLNGLEKNLSEFIKNVDRLRKYNKISTFSITGDSNVDNIINTVLKKITELKKIKDEFDEINKRITDYNVRLEQFGFKNFVEIKFDEFKLEIEKKEAELNKLMKVLKRRKIISNKIKQVIEKTNEEVGINNKNKYIAINVLDNCKKELINNLKNYLISKKRISVFKIIKLNHSEDNEEIILRDNPKISIVKNFSTSLEDLIGNEAINLYGISKVRDEYKTRTSKPLSLYDESSMKTFLNLMYDFDHSDFESRIDKTKLYTIEIKLDGNPLNKINPGTVAVEYLKYYFEKIIQNKIDPIIFLDQPENDIDKVKISTVIKKYFDDNSHRAQFIVTTHEPILVINGDANKVIISDMYDNKFTYKSYNIEDRMEEMKTIRQSAYILDGGVSIIGDRHIRYGGMDI